MSFLIHNDAFVPDKSATFEISNLINGFIEKDNLHNNIIVVPTRKIVKHLKKYLAREYHKKHNKALNHLYIYNLEDFFKQLYSYLELDYSKKLISDGIQLMLIEQAINQSTLEFYKFEDNYLKLDVARKIADIINGLRLDGIRANSTANDYFVFDNRKANDIDTIHQYYESLLGDSLLDIPKLMEELLFKLTQKDTIIKLSEVLSAELKIDSIQLIGFSNFRKLELQILSQFKNLSIPFVINLDYSEIAGPLFGNFQKVLRYFVEQEFKLYSPEPIHLYEEKLNDKLSYHLFDESKETKFKSLSKSLTIIECQNIIDEVRYITKLVKYLNIHQKIPLSQIAIVSRKPENYAGLFFNSFRSENIPINITHRKSISQSVLVRNILLILKLIEGNFSFEQLKLLFESKYIRFENIDSSNFLNTLRILKLRNNNLNFHSDFIKNRAETFLHYLKVNLSTDLDKYTRKDFENRRDNLEKFLSDLTRIQSIFGLFSKKIEINELKPFISKILQQFGIIKSIVLQIEQIQTNKQKYNASEYNDLLESIEAENDALDTFVKLIEKLSQTLPLLGINSIAIRDLLDRLEVASSNEKYQIREKENFGVTITSMDQIRLLPYQVKILCGAIDGSLPLVYNVEKFLGKELIDGKYEHYRSEKVLFYQFLEDISWQKYQSQKFITYPKMTSTTLNTISPFVDALIRNSTIKEDGRIINSTDDNDILPINRVVISKTDLIKSLSTGIILDRNSGIKALFLPNANNVIASNIAQKIELNNHHKKIISKKHYAISDFEYYTRCPYYYYLKKLLNVEFQKEKEIKLEPIEVGSIIHKILYEFFTSLSKETQQQNDNFHSVRLTKPKLDYYKEKLQQIAQQELNNPLYDHPFIKMYTNKFLSSRKSINPLLFWIEIEVGNQQNRNLYPTFFEYPITVELDNPTNKNEKITYSLKIDRIDIETIAPDEYNFSVIDYKIKPNAVRDKDILEFKSFQIPLYLISVIEHFQKKNIKFTPLYGHYYFILSYKNYEAKVLDSQDKKKSVDILDVINSSKAKTFEIKNNIANGLFTITNDEKNCRFCEMESICRRKTKN